MNETTLDGQSRDIVSDNLSKIKELFPEVITEDKIDFEKLELILGKDIDTGNERYSFTWPGKTQAIKESQKQSTGTLRPCKEESKDWDTTENLYIEGDNLEVLKLLQKSYYGKIKAIYIDPPYNTGKDFVYKDNYKDNLKNYLELTGQVNEGEKLTTNTEFDGRYHSNWLNMIYPRLKLARNLLTEDGAIFISINEHEFENLKKICDEIFGEFNYVVSLIWKKSSGSGNDSKYLMIEHEYILLYSKNKNSFKFNNKRKKLDDSSYKLKDEYYDVRGSYALEKLDRGSKGYIVSLDYPIIAPDGSTIYPNGRNSQYDDGWRWMWSSDKLEWGLENDFIVFKKNSQGKWNVYNKRYALVDNEGNEIIRTELYKSHIGFDEPILNIQANFEIKRLFDKNYFSFPKPSKLLNYLLQMIDCSNNFVLDFFSGSGTTADSIFQINKDNSSNNKFILVQLQEPLDERSEAYKAGYKNICEIGKERIRRAGDKIVEESKNKDLDIGFKVFKLDSSNLEKWDPDYNNLEQTLLTSKDNIKPDRTQEDLIYEIMLKYGIDLTLPIEKHELNNNTIYSIGFGALLICLDNQITKEIASSIIELSKDSEVTRVVFKDNGFKSDSDKTNIKETLRTHNIDEFITI